MSSLAREIRLPLLADEAIPLTCHDGVADTTPPARRILVVDDEPDAAMSLATLLRLRGNSVRIVYSGDDAVEAVENFRPEIVLMDIEMPISDGYETTRRIRQQPWGRDALIIALTGRGQDEDRAKSQEAGCTAHLVKPVRLADLETQFSQVR